MHVFFSSGCCMFESNFPKIIFKLVFIGIATNCMALSSVYCSVGCLNKQGEAKLFRAELQNIVWRSECVFPLPAGSRWSRLFGSGSPKVTVGPVRSGCCWAWRHHAHTRSDACVRDIFSNQGLLVNECQKLVCSSWGYDFCWFTAFGTFYLKHTIDLWQFVCL